MEDPGNDSNLLVVCFLYEENSAFTYGAYHKLQIKFITVVLADDHRDGLLSVVSCDKE